jgi:hypothetical protein
VAYPFAFDALALFVVIVIADVLFITRAVFDLRDG